MYACINSVKTQDYHLSDNHKTDDELLESRENESHDGTKETKRIYNVQSDVKQQHISWVQC